MVITPLSLLVAYFLLAPSGKMGLNAGANGLAVKMVLMNIIGVNAQLYFNAKQMNFSFWQFLRQQLLIVACLVTLALCATFGVDHVFMPHGKIIPNFLFAGASYSLAVMIIVCLFPTLFGLRRQDIQSAVGIIKKRIR